MNAPSPVTDGHTVRADWTRHAERGSPWMLRWMARLSLRIGRRWSHPLLYPITGYFFLFAPMVRRRSMLYLARVLGRPARARDWYRLLMSFATVIHDRVFLLNERWDEFRFSVHGAALLARRPGNGALLMGAHVGSFEAIRAVGRQQPGLRVAMAMYPDNAHKVAAMLRAIAPGSEMSLIALGRTDALLRIRDWLDTGALVGMLADRSVDQEAGYPVEFLGATAWLPLAPLRAAAVLRRPVIFMLGLYTGDNHYEVVFEPLADFTAVEAGQRDAEVHQALLRYARLLEKYCRRYPYNWFNFHDFWQRPAGGRDAQQ